MLFWDPPELVEKRTFRAEGPKYEPSGAKPTPRNPDQKACIFWVTPKLMKKRIFEAKGPKYEPSGAKPTPGNPDPRSKKLAFCGPSRTLQKTYFQSQRTEIRTLWGKTGPGKPRFDVETPQSANAQGKTREGLKSNLNPQTGFLFSLTPSGQMGSN